MVVIRYKSGIRLNQPPLPEINTAKAISNPGSSGIKIRSGNELKFIYPQLNFNPEDFQQFDFQYFYIQPMDGANIQEHIQQSLDFCLQHPTWRLSIQTHKLLGIR